MSSSFLSAVETGFHQGVNFSRKHHLATKFVVLAAGIFFRRGLGEVAKNALSWNGLIFCGGVVALYYGYKLGKYYLVELPPIRASLRQEEARTQQLMTIREAQEFVFGAYTMLDQELQHLPPQEVN
ncbi:MAG TPA: hypothetical protein VLG44_06425 [Chlamydiales bacterium]|nr:hypothetical protein [Chlamydiales bacterium]